MSSERDGCPVAKTVYVDDNDRHQMTYYDPVMARRDLNVFF